MGNLLKAVILAATVGWSSVILAEQNSTLTTIRVNDSNIVIGDKYVDFIAECLSGDCTNGTGEYRVKRKRGISMSKSNGNSASYQGALKPRFAGSVEISKAYKYEGEFKNGMPNGKGIVKFGAETYEGEFKNGEFDGQGTYTAKPDNTTEVVFEGAWQNGNFLQGIAKFASDDNYQGEWKEGKFSNGTYTLANGDTYQGEWVEVSKNPSAYHFRGTATIGSVTKTGKWSASAIGKGRGFLFE